MEAAAQAQNAMSDEDLLERYCRRQDRHALGELFGRHGPAVARVCSRMLPTERAQDGVQETFLAVIQNARKFRRDAPLRCWLLGIAANTCRQMARGERNLNRREDAVVAASPSTPPTPAVEAVRAEELRALREVLLQLPDDARSAVVLHYGEGLTRVEVAQALQRPEGTVASWLRNGLDSLREKMRARGHAVSEAGVLALLPVLPVTISPEVLGQLAADTVSAAAVPAGKAISGATLMKIGGVCGVVIALVLGGSLSMNGFTADKAAATAPIPAPKGEQLALLADGSVRVVLQSRHFDDGGQKMTLSADGQLLLTWDSGETFLWRVGTPLVLLLKIDGSAGAAAFCPDGKTFFVLGTGMENALRQYDIASGQLLKTFDTPGEHSNDAVIAFVAGNSQVITNGKPQQQGRPIPPALLSFDIATGKAAAPIDVHEITARSAVPPPNETPLAQMKRADREGFQGMVMASVLNGTAVAVARIDCYSTAPVLIYEIATGKRLRICVRKEADGASEGNQTYSTLMASTDGAYVAEGRRINRKRRITVWDAATGEVAGSLESNDISLFIASRGGMVFNGADEILYGGDDGIYRWKFKTTEKPVKIFAAECPSIWAAHTDDILISRPTSQIINLKTMKATPLPITGSVRLSDVMNLAISPGGRAMAVSSVRSLVSVWDLGAVQMCGGRDVGPHPEYRWDQANRMSFTQNAKSLFVAHGTRGHEGGISPKTSWNVEAWDLATGKIKPMLPAIVKTEAQCFGGMAINDRFFVASTPKGLDVYGLDAAHPGTQIALPVPKGPFGNSDARLTLPNGSDVLLAPGSCAGSKGDQNHIVSLKGAENRAVSGVAYSGVVTPNRRWAVLTGEKSVEIRLCATGQLLAELPPGVEFQFDSTGRYLAYTGEKDIQIVSVPEQPAPHKLPAETLAKLTGLTAKLGEDDFDARTKAREEIAALGFDALEELRARIAERKKSGKENVAELEAAAEDVQNRCDAALGREFKVAATLPLKMIQFPKDGSALMNLGAVSWFWHLDYALMPGGKGIMFGTHEGAMLADLATGREIARFRAFSDGKWLITTPEGWIAGSVTPDLVHVVKDGVDITSADTLRTLTQPEKIKECLRPYILDPKEFEGTLKVPGVQAKPDAVNPDNF